MTSTIAPFARLLQEFRPGLTVYLPGATGQITPLYDALTHAPDQAAGIHFVGCFVPGMNELDYAGLHEQAHVTTFMLPRAMRPSFEAGRVNLVAASYAEAAAHLSGLELDIVVAHVAPPDEAGLCSLGVASDFSPLVWAKARRRVLVVNPLMPRMRRGPRLLLCEADMVLEVECPLVTAPEAATSQTLQIIARQVADLIPHGAAIQAGIGGAPGALWPHLRAHRDLTLRSGMANEDLRDLAESGALRPGGDHRVGIAYGSSDFYRYLADSDLVAFDTTIATHGHAALAGVSRLHAVNSALEIDLLGQVNSEWQDGRLTSGVGGAIDFARAARASAGGRSIIALPATAKQAAVSRIVTRLQVPASMARSDIDTVVTEHGVAMIRNLGLDARAEALIAIAAPGFRSQLREEWSRVRPQI